jgi:hypothetical protein
MKCCEYSHWPTVIYSTTLNQSNIPYHKLHISKHRNTHTHNSSTETHTHTHTHSSTETHTHTHIQAQKHTHTKIQAQKHTHTHSSTETHTHTRIQAQKHTHTHIYSNLHFTQSHHIRCLQTSYRYVDEMTVNEFDETTAVKMSVNEIPGDRMTVDKITV